MLLGAGVTMLDYLQMLLRADDFAPHGYCLLWQPELIWTHVVADSLIAAAYFSIPIAIIRFVRRRGDIEFSWIFWLFALFILACGTTHLMAIWTLWNGDYGWEAAIKIVTAIASVGTAIVLWPLIPRALAIPSPLQLRAANSELTERVRERDAALERLQHEMEERQRAEDALRQAQKMEAVGQLTGGIAHDFNNLLQAVSGTFELIERSPNDADRVRRWARKGRDATERGSRLTGQLLAFSRTQRLDLKPVSLSPLIENLVDLLARTIGTSIKVHVELGLEPLAVIADPTQLELALINLSINARDAMPRGGTLTISVAPDPAADPDLFPEGAVAIRVSDTGDGMTDEVRQRAFEPFFTTKGVGKGTGLGLSMVYGVASQSGGTAHIHSERGAGTAVTLTLRRCDVPEDDAGSASTMEPETETLGDGEAILVVDDDPDVRSSTRQALDSLGYRVSEADGGQAAVDMVARWRPDLVVMDFAMPGMNGAEAAARIAQIHPGVPILFASGYADTAAVEAAVGAGTPFLRKPFHIADLAAAVAGRLSKARARR
jgi:signal transduction histidine kinase/ActR/RegA family two-component response regulator